MRSQGIAAHVSGAEALRAAIARLREAGIEDAARDARALLAHALQIGPDRLTLHLQDDLTPAVQERFQAGIAARSKRQPVSQIIGSRLFWGLRLEVTPDVLDPRPETEILVQAALQVPFATVLDMGTGSGAIVLSCVHSMPGSSGQGIDISQAALDVAGRNAARLGLSPRVTFVRSDWFAGVQGHYDLIVSNPPYIAEVEMAGLDPEVRLHEPHLALTPGGDGLAAYRILSAGARAHLVPGGRICFEIGPTQGAAVMGMLQGQGFTGLKILPDLDGRDRVVMGSAPT